MRAPPLITIELDRIVQNAQRLRRCAEATFAHQRLRIFFALKAHPLPRLLEILKPLDVGCEVMTPAQLSWAMALDVPTIASGLFKPKAILEAYTKLGYLVLETPHELERLSQVCQVADCPIRVVIRIKAHVRAKVGLSLNDLLGIRPRPGIEVVGLHFHAGWNVRDVNIINEAVASIVEARKVLTLLGHRITIMNFGGSFCEPSVEPKQLPARLEMYAKAVDSQIEEIHLEPGRYLVGDAGGLTCTIEFVDKKERVIFVDTCAYGYRLTGGTPHVELIDATDSNVGIWSIHGFWPSDSDVLNNISIVGSPEKGHALLMHNMGAYVLGLEGQFALNEPIRILYR